MTKCISFKRILIGLFILLTLLLLNCNPVHASGWTPGIGGEGEEVKDNSNDGGITYARTGFLLCLVGDDGHTILNSEIAFFPYGNNNTWSSCVGAGTIKTTYFNEEWTTFYTGTPINNIAAFNGETAGGPIVQQFLLQSPSTLDSSYNSNAEYIVEKNLGVALTDLADYIKDNDAYIQVVPVYWARLQHETKEKQYNWYVGNPFEWAKRNGFPTYISSYTHRIAPQCTHMIEDWWTLNRLSGYKYKGDYWPMDESVWRSNGLGIGGIKCNNNFQVVIAIETPGGWQTQYTSCDGTYEVKSEINGAQLVTSDSGFASKEFTSAKETNASYSDVISGCTKIGGNVGPGTFDFLTRNECKALFLHYKGEVKTESTSITDLYAWELTYRLPGCKAGSTNSKRTDMGIEHHPFNSMQSLVNAWQNEQLSGTSDVLEKRELNRSQPTDHDYRLTQDHGRFNIGGGIWQLYRGPYTDLWERFPDLYGRVWTVNDKIDPNYGYYLGRSQLESLGLVVDRENGITAGEYLSTPKGFVVGYDGKEGASQSSNTRKTHTNVAPYNWRYTAHWTGQGAWIEYEYRTRERLPHSNEYGCFGDNPETPAPLIETDYLICDDNHYTPWTPWKYTRPTEVAAAFYNYGGSYGNHNIDKYKSQITATGISGHAGEASVGTSGVDLKGKFVKGSDFDYTGRISKAIHGSQFPESYKLYGEIPMLFWVQGTMHEYDYMTAETAFVWSEFERSIRPSMVHGFKTEITGSGQMDGLGSLATAATGHTAQTVKSQSSATTLGLTYMGTTFNVATKNQYYFDIYSLGFTTEDEKAEGINANSAWGNEHSQVQSAHNMYVSSVLAGVQQEIIMELTFKPSGKKLYYTMLTDTQGIVNQSTSKVGDYDLWWKNNGFAANGTDYSGFYDSGIAESYLNLRELYDGTLINNGESHDGQKNESQQSSLKDYVNGGAGSYAEYTGYGSWYDEESFYRFEVEKWHTKVTMDCMGITDKIDYNLLTQSVLSNYLNQKDYIEVRFYTRLWRDTDAPYTDGYYSWPSNRTFRVDKIQNVDFTVINQSTEDLKK